MKIQNKKELQQVASNHSFDISIKESIILYKIYIVKPYFFLAINNSLASDNPLNLRYNLLERMWKLIIITDDKIRDEKLQFDINREVTNIFPLSSGKVNNNEYLTGEKIFSFQNQVKDRAKFTY